MTSVFMLVSSTVARIKISAINANFKFVCVLYTIFAFISGGSREIDR